MKSLLTLAFVLSLFATVSGYAADQVTTDENGNHVTAPVPTQEQMDEATAAIDEALNAHGYWHCTAYAEGHGHAWGFDYRDIHYNHAYWGAVQTCERATGHHCHDVHCHYDHH